ncbi:hypothetical protein BE18_24125 [Sorangium cellulosum]|uniref:Uncharacterized protein n=1 Tax=Sorangium cellulosum TaxID=56 RepID=A0A150SFN5_SORCE|nr:hypothetical protein BE18_24125 [Sorangium cellulosum]
MGAEVHALRSWESASSRARAQSGSCSMSDTITGCLRWTAVPHEPLTAPMRKPSTSWLYASGRLGADAQRRCVFDASTRRTEQSALPDWASMNRISASSTRESGSPAATIRRIRFCPRSRGPAPRAGPSARAGSPSSSPTARQGSMGLNACMRPGSIA